MVAFSGVEGKLTYERLEMMRFIRKHGISSFRPNPHFPLNSLMMMRGAIVAGMDGRFDEYVEAGLKHMWEEGLKLDDPAVFVTAMTEAGFDGEDLLERCQDPNVKARLISNTEAAVARGAFGMPTFYVGDEMFFGKERLGQLEELLNAPGGIVETTKTDLGVWHHARPQTKTRRQTLEFRNAIFAGGGSRCFWQMGFWKGANDAGLDLSGTVKYAAGVSAGCASATAAMLDRCDEALEVFVQLTSRNPRNVHWWNLKPGSTGPLLPHMNMYREGLKMLLTPSDLDALSHKHVEFLMARFPRFLPSAIGTLSAFVTYGIEKRVTGRLHPLWTRRMGFKPLTAGNHEAADIADLMDAILASSCVPPVLPTKGYRGYRILDGGVIDNVPAFLADGRPGSTLVLLSKRYRRPLPGPAQRVYVQPSQPIEIDKFDYANPSGLEKIFDLGKADGAQFAKSHLLSARQGTAVIRENGLHADGGQPR